jgi:hypothetical protein
LIACQLIGAFWEDRELAARTKECARILKELQGIQQRPPINMDNQEQRQELDHENPHAEGKDEDDERQPPIMEENDEKADQKEEGQEIARENQIEEAHPAEQRVEANVEEIKDSDEQQEQAQANSPESGLVGEELKEEKFEDKPENLPRSADDVVDQRLPPDHLSERNGRKGRKFYFSLLGTAPG